jgi:hypothetical protein
MPALDFKEIPSANGSDGTQDTFELLCNEYLEFIGLNILVGPDRGQDGGRDLIVVETRTGVLGNSEFKWLVSCKHKSHSGKSVLDSDEEDILGRVQSHGAHGFIGFYSTVPSSGLTNKLERYKTNGNLIYKIINLTDIEKNLINTSKGRSIAKRYFPLSYSKWESNSIPSEPSSMLSNFHTTLSQASYANANGYWLSIVADYGEGYRLFESSSKHYIWNWSIQLFQSIFQYNEFRRRSGKDYVELSFPDDEFAPPIFRVNYTNNGIVTIQWRGDSSAIYLDWIIALCLDAVVKIINSPIVAGLSPIRLGFALSNAPEQGISTSTVFKSNTTTQYFRSRGSTWMSSVDEIIEIDDYIKFFVNHTLSSWGYIDYEEKLDVLSLKIVRTEFLLRQNNLGYLL